MSQPFLLLTESDVRELLPMRELIDVMAGALARFSAREVLQPVRTVLSVGPTQAFFGLMPAYLPSIDDGASNPAGGPPTQGLPAEPARLGAKLVTVFHGNHARGLPSHLATIVLLDPDSGALQGLMDGRYITEARTAAVSAVSVQQLAAPQAATLAIIGSGVQARSHLHAISAVRQLREVRVWSPAAESRDRFVSDMQPRVPMLVRACTTARAAVAGADLVVLVTSAKTPVIESDWIASGAHVVAVGACRPDEREMDPALVARGRLFVDSRAAALVEAGDIVCSIREGRIAETHIAGELGDVVRRRVPGRSSETDVTVFKSLGMAVEDVAAASLVLTRARAAGRGQELQL